MVRGCCFLFVYRWTVVSPLAVAGGQWGWPGCGSARAAWRRVRPRSTAALPRPPAPLPARRAPLAGAVTTGPRHAARALGLGAPESRREGGAQLEWPGEGWAGPSGPAFPNAGGAIIASTYYVHTVPYCNIDLCPSLFTEFPGTLWSNMIQHVVLWSYAALAAHARHRVG